MPDEIGWPTPEEEMMLAAACAEANAAVPSTPEDDAQLERDCAAAERYRLERERRKRGTKKSS